MRRRLLIELVLVVILLGGGIAGYFQVVPIAETDFTPLGRLVLSNPEVANINAVSSFSAQSPIASSNLTALTAGAALDPGQTGAYTSQWFGLGAKGGELTTFLEMLPNDTLGAQAATEQMTDNLNTAALTTLKDNVQSDFTIPGVANSAGVYYLIPEPAKKGSNNKVIPQPPQHAYTGLIRVGRVVERIDLQGPAANKPALIQFAQRSAKLIESRVGGWKSMAYTAYPVGATIAWFAVLAVLLAIVFLVPVSRDRLAAARLAREEARRRYELRSRGAKVVRRQRVRR